MYYMSMRIINPFRIGFLGGLGVLLVFILWNAISAASAILMLVASALFLALGVDPIISWLEKRHVKRALALAIILSILTLIIVLIVFAIVPSINNQITNLTKYTNLTSLLLNADITQILQSSFFGLNTNVILEQIGVWLDRHKETIVGGILQTGIHIVGGVFGTIIVFALTLYFAVSIHTIKDTFYKLIPRSKRTLVIKITENITLSIGKYVLGLFALASINGTLTFIFLTAINGSVPLVFALVAFVGSLIPLVGTILASSVIVLGQLFLGEITSNIWWISIIWFFIYMQIEAYVLSPKIMSNALKVPTSIIVIAALIGGGLMGILGAILAVPIAGGIVILIKEIAIPAQNNK